MAPRKIITITRSSLHGLDSSDAAYITDVKDVSSYSWVDTSVPTIAVPGSPPLWSPPDINVPLPKDRGLYYIAENAARLPASPMAPIFRAIFATDPTFDVQPIDVITDRHNIRKLLAYIKPGSDRDKGGSFTMRLELVRNTLLMCRLDLPATEYIQPHEYRGHGHEYEKAYTTKQFDGTAGHHRIVSYRFCGLNFLIRYETDGCVSPKKEAGIAHKGLFDPSDLLSLPFAKQASPAARRSSPKMKVLLKGKTVPPESILEIKTRILGRSLDFADVAPQLWVSQTSKLVRAFHVGGCFEPTHVEDVSAALQKWESDNQKNLRTLGALLSEFITVLKGSGGRGTLRYDAARDRLTISRYTGETRLLPEDLYSEWNERKRGAARTQESESRNRR
ncbi:hypothetical protein E4U47_005094 [Claviceps purpurea]|nr:hypothetical protein E4U37_006587 [Claviceps purpurea]KAG6267784.1 hypothetical protein E4U47_005094 [Claviceps purpurea]